MPSLANHRLGTSLLKGERVLFLEHRHLHYDLKVAVRQMQALRVQEIKSALLDTYATSPKHNITIYSNSSGITRIFCLPFLRQ